METAKIAEPMSGDKLYQQRARAALPILIRQALANKPIYYGDLADELLMPNPRNLNYVLGSIGRTLNNLSIEWNEEIPPIQCLVLNQHTGLPGEGVGEFLANQADYGRLSRTQQRRLVDAALYKVFTFQKWHQVLSALDLQPVSTCFSDVITQASTAFEGESYEHRALKEYIAHNPAILNLPQIAGPGEMEHKLPSGDALDVFFDYHDEHIGVEVKSHLSPLPDIVRGLFQCVKYQAVLEARQAAQGLLQQARAVLILGQPLPAELFPLKNVLGIEVIDDIQLKR